MPGPIGIVKANMAYAYVAMGVIWLAVVAATGLVLVLWPVGALLAGGALMKFLPEGKLTWAWTLSAGVMAVVLAAYQAASAAPLITGTFAVTAGISLAVFTLLALAHLALLYLGFLNQPK